MLKKLQELYLAAHTPPPPAGPTMQERIDDLYRTAVSQLIRYTNDSLPLYVSGPHRIRHVTMKTIETDMIAACKSGGHFVEYTSHKHLYPGHRGDNVSLFTEKYYLIVDEKWVEIDGAPSYLGALRIRMPGLAIIFTETSEISGVLRIELPLDFLEQKMRAPVLK